MDECTKDPLMRTDVRELVTERRSDVIPVYEGDHSRLVIDVVHVQVRVIGVVDYKRTTEAVAVLRRYVAVVPERPCMGWDTVTVRYIHSPVLPGRALLPA